MTLQDTDKFLVERSNTSSTLQKDQIMAELLDTDLMLVSRSGVPFKATGLEIKDSLGPPLNAPIIDTVALSEVDPEGERYTGKSFSTAINCKPISSVPITYELKATSEGTLVKQPETSVITGVSSSSTTYSSYLSGTNAGTSDVLVVENPEYVFDGSTSTEAAAINGVPGDTTIVFELPEAIDFADKVEIWCTNGNLNSVDQFVDVNDTGLPGLINTNFEPNRYAEVATGPGLLKKISIQNTNATRGISRLSAIRVDGKVLTDGDVLTTLTLTDDTDLALFTPDMVVNQNSSGTPVSSEITSVDLQLLTTAGTDNSINTFTNQSEVNNAFDGNPNTKFGFTVGGAVPDQRKVWVLSDPILVAAGSTIKVDGLCGEGFCPTIKFTDGTGLNPNSGDVTYPDSKYIESLTTGKFSGSGQYSYIRGILVNGEYLTVGSYLESKVLTLTDDTNLANFRVGDIVQGGSNQSEVWSNTPWSSTLNDPLLVWNGNINDGAYTLPQGPSTYTFATPITKITSLRFYLSASPGGDTRPEGFKVNGNNYGTLLSTTAEWVTVPETSLTSFSILGESSVYNCVVHAVEVNGQILVDAGLPDPDPNAFRIAVISEDPPSITTSGGTWADGDVVTGPSVTASGTVASVDEAAKTITLSESTGRWLVTKPNYLNSKKVNKSVVGPITTVNNVKLYTIFDAEGNVSDLSEADPGYRQILSDGSIFETLDLTFPLVLPNGKTPDETLPEGATLCVDVKADNDGGTDFMLHEESGACVTPEGTGPGPTAVMYGLRFDSTRGTELTRSGTGTGTLSYWAKTGADWFYVHDSDAAYPAAIGDGFNGYLSEYYFVDNQSLPATAFGYDYEDQGKWAPLENTVIKQNIEDAKAAAFPDDNTSQVWSRSPKNMDDASNAFDGALQGSLSNVSVTGGKGGFNFSGLTVNTSLVVYYGSSTAGNLFVNGVPTSVSSSPDNVGTPIDMGFTGNVTSIEIQTGSKGAIYGIKVDDEILVDGGFGPNGFYLPFNPAAVVTGTRFSFQGELKPVTDNNNSPEIFFADTTSTKEHRTLNAVDTDRNGVLAATYNFYDAPEGTYTIYFGNNKGAGASWADVFTVNGVTPPMNITSDLGFNSAGDFTNKYQFTGKLESITQDKGYEGSHESRLYLILFNGQTFTAVPDYSNIGVDDSGNGNNFADQNFIIGDDFLLVPSTIEAIATGHDSTDERAKSVFNGSTTVGYYGSGDSRVRMTMQLPTPLSLEGVTLFEFYAYVDAREGDVTFTFKSSTGASKSITIPTKKSSTPYTVNMSGLTNLSEITWLSNDGSYTYGYIYAISLDGNIVTWNNPDTVTDTPLKNYATLLTGSNGNLVPTSDSSTTYLGEVGTDYYYEEDSIGKVHTGGATFSSTSGKVYNFGQQPFANAGLYNDSQVWSSNVTPTALPAVNMYDGDLTTRCGNTPASGNAVNIVTSTFNPPLLNVTILEVGSYGAQSSYNELRINGGTWVPNVENASLTNWTTVYAGPGVTVNTLEFRSKTSSYSSEARGVRVNGVVLVDTGNPLAAAYGNNLFQTWEQWNNVETLFATNPIQVARFEVIKEALETYEGDKVEFRTGLMQKVSTALTAEEMAVVAVLMQ